MVLWRDYRRSNNDPKGVWHSHPDCPEWPAANFATQRRSVNHPPANYCAGCASHDRSGVAG